MENPANVNNAEELADELQKAFDTRDSMLFAEALVELVQEAEYWKEACRHVLETQS